MDLKFNSQRSEKTMKKIIAIALTCICVIAFAGCYESTVLDEAKVYEVEAEIHSMLIEINAADFTIIESDKFLVESNLKYLSVKEEGGVLSIIEEYKPAHTCNDAMLTLYLPEGSEFDTVDIKTGAAKLTADALSAKTVKLQLGAGDVTFGRLDATSSAIIEGGAGKISVNSGILNNLDLTMGIGELNLKGSLVGNSEFVLGVGASNITLIGKKSDYKIEIQKGIGSITVDGEAVTDFENSGSGGSSLKIEGGVGSINLNFKES